MELYNKIIYFIFIIITEGIIVYNYKQMSNKKTPKNSRTIIYLLLICILVYINNFYNYLNLRLYTGIIITAYLWKIIYNVKYKETLFYSIIHAIIYILLELILSPILILNAENITMFNNDLIIKCIFSLTIGVMSIFLFKIKKLNETIEKIKIVLSKINFYAYLIIILLFMNFMIVIRAVKTSDYNLIIITIICALFMGISIKIIINDKYNLTLLKDRNKNIKEQYIAYAKTIDEYNEFKHNLKNDLYTLKTTLPESSQENINKIILKYNKNYEWINKIVEMPEGLQGLIYLKQKEAQHKKITMHINVVKDIKIDNQDYINLCDTLGILLDNAIEASIHAKSKIVDLTINYKKNGLIIKIINKHKNNIDITKIGKKNYSTKEYKSGLGLNYIRNIKNPKIKVYFKIVNNLFITDINYI